MTFGICLPCLTLVAFPLDAGREEDARREARTIAPTLWDEGLEPTVLFALERAKRDGVVGAQDAVEDVRRAGPRAVVTHAIVSRLAEQLVEDMQRRRSSQSYGTI
jgi:hypothetical protein